MFDPDTLLAPPRTRIPALALLTEFWVTRTVDELSAVTSEKLFGAITIPPPIDIG